MPDQKRWRGCRLCPVVPDHVGILALRLLSGASLLVRNTAAPRLGNAMRMLRDAMDSLASLSERLDGEQLGAALLARCAAVASHVAMNWDAPAENFDRMEFGLPLNQNYSMF